MKRRFENYDTFKADYEEFVRMEFKYGASYDKFLDDFYNAERGVSEIVCVITNEESIDGDAYGFLFVVEFDRENETLIAVYNGWYLN